ncbi:MAG: DUF4440 domain-containing protein [bacterium]|nr:DUF4440 domain-containing protein [bacterium]
MRKALLFLALFGAIRLFAQTQHSDLDTVLSYMKSQETFWNRGDIPGFMDYYWKSDSLKFIGRTGVNYGWQTTFGNYLKNYPNREAMGTLKFTVMEASQLCTNSIFIVGKWELIKDKPAGGHFSLLWKKKNGNWRIVTDHTS